MEPRCSVFWAPFRKCGLSRRRVRTSSFSEPQNARGNIRPYLMAMCEILQCGGGGEEVLAEPCVSSAHCSQTAVTGRQGRLE